MTPRPVGLQPTCVQQPNSCRSCGSNTVPSLIAVAITGVLQNSVDFPQSMAQIAQIAMLEAGGRSPPYRTHPGCLCSWSNSQVKLWRKEV